ncbi:hypothetical protein Sjap_015412 [Stephania japonica]|uniref:Uncharacterized protein n=1 Tax=Stephania japonica TaxID=461633 RepID=A0AAP0IJI9_9MAGN
MGGLRPSSQSEVPYGGWTVGVSGGWPKFHFREGGVGCQSREEEKEQPRRESTGREREMPYSADGSSLATTGLIEDLQVLGKVNGGEEERGRVDGREAERCESRCVRGSRAREDDE